MRRCRQRTTPARATDLADRRAKEIFGMRVRTAPLGGDEKPAGAVRRVRAALRRAGERNSPDGARVTMPRTVRTIGMRASPTRTSARSAVLRAAGLVASRKSGRDHLAARVAQAAASAAPPRGVCFHRTNAIQRTVLDHPRARPACDDRRRHCQQVREQTHHGNRSLIQKTHDGRPRRNAAEHDASAPFLLSINAQAQVGEGA